MELIKTIIIGVLISLVLCLMVFTLFEVFDYVLERFSCLVNNECITFKEF